MNLCLPQFSCGLQKIDQAFQIACGDVAGNIALFRGGLLPEAESVFLAGKSYSSPWTRDAAFNVWYGGFLAPEVSYNTLLAVLEKDEHGRLRIGGEYWDKIIWAIGAWQYQLWNDAPGFANLALEAIENTLAEAEARELDPADGLFRGGACFQDGVAAYPDCFVSMKRGSGIMDYLSSPPPGAKIAPAGTGLPMKALSTNALYCAAYRIADRFRKVLGKQPAHQESAQKLKDAVNRRFRNPATGTYRYLLDADDPNPERQEGLGHAFALLSGIVPEEERTALIKNVHTTPHGIPCVWPQMERYAGTPGVYARHSGVIWPQVNAAWCSALTACGERELAFHETELLADKAFRDKMFREVYHPDTGLPYGGIQEKGADKGIVEWASCPRQTWAAMGFIHMVLRTFLGLHADESGLDISPVFPEGCEEIRLDGLHYRNAVLNLRIRRGSSALRHIPADIKGNQTIQI